MANFSDLLPIAISLGLEISFITSVNAKFIPLLLRGKQDEELYQHLNNVLNKECLIQSLTKHIKEAEGYREVKGK